MIPPALSAFFPQPTGVVSCPTYSSLASEALTKIIVTIFISRSYSRWEAGGSDVFAEGDLLGQVDEGDVGIEAVGVPLGVSLTLERGDLNSVRLRTGADVVGSGWSKVSSCKVRSSLFMKELQLLPMMSK